MKKIIAIVVTLSTLFAAVPLTAGAKTNKIVGHVYTSDIVAYIDDMPIKSYNIGGQTVVSENELARYGFQVTWNGKTRKLYIVADEKPQERLGYSDETVAEKQATNFDVYETDIKVYVNGTSDLYEVPAYNIDGVTMIPLRALDPENEEDNNTGLSYSHYGFQVIWNAKHHVVEVYSLRKGNEIDCKYGDYPIVGICLQYNHANGYNQDIKADTIIPNKCLNVAMDKPLVNIDKVLTDYFGVTYQWNEGVYRVRAVKLDMKPNDVFDDQNADDSNGILPIVEVPIDMNWFTCTVKMVIYRDSLYTDMTEWENSLLK